MLRNMIRSGGRQRNLVLSIAACTSALIVSACGVSLPNITGGLGGAAKPAAPVITNDPTSRAIQVGRVAGRAQKCGFVFDATKLRTQFLMSESASTADAAAIDKIGKTYDIAQSATLKAIGSNAETYCNTLRTSQIKVALNRHLGGDYTPDQPEPVVEDAGLFGSLSPNNKSSEGLPNPEGPFHPSTAP